MRIRTRPAPDRRLAAALAVLVLATLPTSATSTDSPAATPDWVAILEAAFSNRFDVDTISNIELVTRDHTGQELRRLLRGVSKVIDGRVHSIGQITWPERLRGMTVLTIEALDRSHDAFVYLPSLKRVRRVTTAQRGESFFGTDVTYEDLERRRVSDYELESVKEEERLGEPVFVVAAASLRGLSYDRVEFVIAKSDFSMLETLYYKREQPRPFRTISAPRESMLVAGGHVLPTRLFVVDHARARTTDVHFDDLEVNPEIDDRIFSVGTLEQERTLPKSEPAEAAH